MELMNQVRGYHFLLGVLRHQQRDPYCGVCSAYANTLKAARENLAKLEAEHTGGIAALAQIFSGMPLEARTGLSALSVPAEPTGQKKAGNCKLPQGMCFIKTSFAFVQQI
jgi:hypothetical protein